MLFQALGRVRRARALHPRGLLLDATLRLTAHASVVTAALGGPGERPAVVRVSKGGGLPGGLPDVLGVAVRTPLDDGRVLDLLFSSVGRRGVTRLVLSPSTGWCARPYSTLLPYSAGGRTLLLGLEPEDPHRAPGADPRAVGAAVERAPLVFALTEGVYRPRPVGLLVLESVRAGGAPSYDPVRNAHPGLRPVRFLRRARERAYTGSRRGRGADPAELSRW